MFARISILPFLLALMAAVAIAVGLPARAQTPRTPLPAFRAPTVKSEASTPTGEKKERRIALVIGNSDYQHVVRLSTPGNDAKDMCEQLRSLAFETTCRLDMPTRRALKDAIYDFARELNKGGVGVFYYAGHGVQYRGDNYIVPTGALVRVQADIEDEALGLSYLMENLAEAKNSFNMVILDACRENPFGTARKPGTGGLADVDAPPGTMVVYATSPGKVAFEDDSRNGIFTGQLLKKLQIPGIDAENLIKQVIVAVQEETRRKFHVEQNGWYKTSYTGRFCFAGCEDSQMTQDLARIKREKDSLEERAKQLVADNLESQKKIKALEAQARSVQEELRKRTEEGSHAPTDKEDAEVAKLRQQLEQLSQSNRELANQARQLDLEREELGRLRKTLHDHETDARDLTALKSKLLQMEKERTEKDEQLQRLQQERKDVVERPVRKPRTIDIPPAF